MAKAKHPRSKTDILLQVQFQLNKCGIKSGFKDNLPTDGWWRGFLSLHPDLTLRKPELLGRDRDAVSAEDIERWFAGFLDEEKFELVEENAGRIFNCDESGFPLGYVAGNQKVVSKRGERSVHSVSNADKTQISALFTISAAGTTLPPMIIYEGKRFPKDLVIPEESKDNIIIAKSASGWMQSDMFYEWIVNHFNQWVEEQKLTKPVLFDGHKSHMNIDVSEFCSGNGIIL